MRSILISLLVLPVLLTACAPDTVRPSQQPTPQSTIRVDPAETLPDGLGRVEGRTVSMTRMSPEEVMGPAAIQRIVRVYDQNNQQIEEIESDEAGRFTLDLPPG